MPDVYDVLIIGAGAAGLFAAGTAINNGKSVVVIEKKPSAGAKLLITGKGRCNVTNNCTVDEFLQNVRRNPRFLFSCLQACPPAFVMDLFENELNVPLKTERGRRVFPKSDKAQHILNALIQRASGAKFMYGSAVKSLIIDESAVNSAPQGAVDEAIQLPAQGKVKSSTSKQAQIKVRGVLLQNGKTIAAKNIIVACGGVSYPVTGSTGNGYKLAKQAKHTIITPEPSLVSLVENGNICKKMTGLSLRNVALTLLENGKPIFKEQGELLFTHFGLSGPLVLSASAHINDISRKSYAVTIDTKPALSNEVLAKRIDEDFALMSKKEAANCLTKLLPASMREPVIEVWGINANKQINQITRKERDELLKLMKAFPIKIKSKGDLEHAVITSGGVSTKEINPKTMESKLCEGLYFAGEVIDVDAYTGGYNLGIAFATGHVAAVAANN